MIVLGNNNVGNTSPSAGLNEVMTIKDYDNHDLGIGALFALLI